MERGEALLSAGMFGSYDKRATMTSPESRRRSRLPRIPLLLCRVPQVGPQQGDRGSFSRTHACRKEKAADSISSLHDIVRLSNGLLNTGASG
jgi:hypothetical protein